MGMDDLMEIPWEPCNDTLYLCEFEEDNLPPLLTNAQFMKLQNINIFVNVFLLCFLSLSLILNSLVLVLYYVMGRNSRKIPNLMLFSQAIIDAIICLYALLTTLPHFIPGMMMALPHLPVFVNVTGQYTVFLALGILVLTSGERFLALRRPFFHRRYVSKNKMIAAIVILYIVAFIPCIFYICFTNLRDDGEDVGARHFGVIYTATRLALVFAGIIFVLAVLFFTLRTVQVSIRHRTIRSPMDFGKVDDASKERFVLSERRKEKRMMSIFFTMAAVFTLSYLPMAVINSIKLHQNHAVRYYDMLIAEVIIFVLYIASAFVNPLLTLSLKDDFKRHIVRYVSKKKKTADEIIDPKTELLSTTTM